MRKNGLNNGGNKMPKEYYLMPTDKGLKSANRYIKSTGEKRTGKVFRAGG